MNTTTPRHAAPWNPFSTAYDKLRTNYLSTGRRRK